MVSAWTALMVLLMLVPDGDAFILNRLRSTGGAASARLAGWRSRRRGRRDKSPHGKQSWTAGRQERRSIGAGWAWQLSSRLGALSRTAAPAARIGSPATIMRSVRRLDRARAYSASCRNLASERNRGRQCRPERLCRGIRRPGPDRCPLRWPGGPASGRAGLPWMMIRRVQRRWIRLSDIVAEIAE